MLNHAFGHSRRFEFNAANFLLAQCIKTDLAWLSDDPRKLLRCPDFKRIVHVAFLSAFPGDKRFKAAAALTAEVIDYFDQFLRGEEGLLPSDLSGKTVGPKLESLLASLWAFLGSCKLFTTRDGRLGLVSSQASAGDVVAVLHGVQLPMILRVGAEDTYTVVGTCVGAGLTTGLAVAVVPREAPSRIFLS